jgi:transposase InsO family protein
MAYSSNPLLPKARRFAVNLVIREGLSVSVAARRSGINRSTLYRWMRRAEQLELHWHAHIPTLSSRPHHHPKQLSGAIVQRTIALWHQFKRCSGYIHALLKSEGILISLASVSRILARSELSRTWYQPKGRVPRKRMPRPKVERPGDLVEVDTIHFNEKWGKSKKRHYLYTLIDLKTRWTYAMSSEVINPRVSAWFVLQAQRQFPHRFKVIQTDNGQEFGNEFEARLQTEKIQQRRIRLGKKNDNAHIERFNRTVQDECLGRWPSSDETQEKITKYIAFYNTNRLHSGLQYQTPSSVLQRF